jgi:hypothetical protein
MPLFVSFPPSYNNLGELLPRGYLDVHCSWCLMLDLQMVLSGQSPQPIRLIGKS